MCIQWTFCVCEMVFVLSLSSQFLPRSCDMAILILLAHRMMSRFFYVGDDRESGLSGDIWRWFIYWRPRVGLCTFPPPKKVLWKHWLCDKLVIPDIMCFLELKQPEYFEQRLVLCLSRFVPSAAKSIGCHFHNIFLQHITFESSVKCGDTTEVAVAVWAAFLVAGCTILHSSKIAVSPSVFMSTIVKMYVKQMVDLGTSAPLQTVPLTGNSSTSDTRVNCRNARVQYEY